MEALIADMCAPMRCVTNRDGGMRRRASWVDAGAAAGTGAKDGFYEGASLERRRRLAASGPMPPTLAARFTQGELAALRIVGDEVLARGFCDLHIDAIAARAGVCRTTTQNALRMARQLGMITVQERRRRGQKSLTNIVRIISAEWQSWLRRRTGFKYSSTATTVQAFNATSWVSALAGNGTIGAMTPAAVSGSLHTADQLRSACGVRGTVIARNELSVLIGREGSRRTLRWKKRLCELVRV
jgi:hypothetical protein